MTLNTKQQKVLRKVARELNHNNVHYQLTGGAAAILHGVPRETDDLDFDIALRDVKKVRNLFGKSIIEDYHRYVGEDFDLWLIICEIDGVQVEFGQAEKARILGIDNAMWVELPNTISNSKIQVVGEVQVRVQDKKDLIDYKSVLGREIDRVDVETLLLFE